MNRDEVFELIHEKINELDIPREKDPRVEYCREWVDEHKYISFEDYAKLDIYKLIRYLMPILLDIKDLETCENISELFISFFRCCTPEYILDFVNIAAELLCSEEIDKLICLLDAPNEEEANKIAATIVNIRPEFVENLCPKDGHDKENVIGSDFATLLHVLKNHEDAFFDLLVLLCSHKSANQGCELVEELLERHKRKINYREKKKIADKYLKKHFKFDYSISIANRVGTFVCEKDAEEKKYQRSIEAKREKLYLLEKKLSSALEKEEITNISEIIGNIDDYDLAIAVLKLIKEHNRPYYEELDKEYLELSNNTEANYRALLHDFGIKIKEKEISKIMHLKLDDIRTILEILIRKLSFDEEKVLHVLENSNLERVQLISRYISNGYISVDYVAENIYLYDLDSDDINIIGKNIELLNSYNVNPYMFKNSMVVLFSDSDKLNSNLQLLREYDLLKYLKTTDNFLFLLNNNLSSIIDKYLELNYEFLLKEDMNILNFINIKRLDVIHMLNVPIETVDELYDVLYSKKFFMSDNEIDSYLLNVVEYNEKVNFNYSLEELDNFKVSNRTYSFDGVLVSIQKVKRLLQEGYDLYDSIFNGMYVNEDEYNRVINCLGQNNYSM